MDQGRPVGQSTPGTEQAGNPLLAIEQGAMAPNADIVVLARTKLADRPVVWKEAYTRRTLFLKKQFHETLGPGSYFRFEGHDTDTDDDYFVVVGPAKVHSPKAEFFAGVRKLPADYAAGGLYFGDMKEAMEYANTTWGVQAPEDMRYYDSGDLKGISSKVKKWKEATEDSSENDEDYLLEWYHSIKQEGTVMPVSDPQQFFYEQSNTYPFFTKTAMPTWLKREVGFQWWDIDQIMAGTDRSFNEAAETQPSLVKARDAALAEKAKRQKQITNMYGAEFALPANPSDSFYKIWLVHRGDRGTYIVAVGPYCGNMFEQAYDKFGVFQWKLNLATQSDIDEKVESLIQEYAEKFGITLTRDDINVPVDKRPFAGEITLATGGREKLYGSPEWKRQILDRYGVQPGAGMTANLKKNYRERLTEWKRLCDEAYAVSQENGQAFENQQPEPPSISLIKRMYGQQIPRSILRQNVDGISKLEQIEKYGFDSIQEAVDHLNTTAMPGAPVGDVPSTTKEDLSAARRKKEATDAASGEPAPAQVQKQRKVRVEKLLEDKPEGPVEQPAEMAPKPVAEPASASDDHEFADISFNDVTAGSSLLRMIKMAEDLDAAGKYREAEEIHVILRKHIVS